MPSVYQRSSKCWKERKYSSLETEICAGWEIYLAAAAENAGVRMQWSKKQADEKMSPSYSPKGHGSLHTHHLSKQLKSPTVRTIFLSSQVSSGVHSVGNSTATATSPSSGSTSALRICVFMQHRLGVARLLDRGCWPSSGYLATLAGL